MSLEITNASSDVDLTTTSALRSLVFGATATSTSSDVYLSAIIRRASRWAESYIGVPLTLQTYSECVAGFGSRRLVLARTPITAVMNVFDATDTGTATEILTTEYRVQDRDAGFLSRDQGFGWSATLQAPAFGSAYTRGPAFPLSPEPVPGDEYEPWLVRYKAGWTYGGVDTGSNNWSTVQGTTSTGRTLPEDIEYAVLVCAQEMFENRNDVVSEGLGDLRVSYNASSGSADQPKSYERMLDPYRRYA